MHARAGASDVVDVLHALRGLQQGVDEDRLGHAVFGFELRQDLVHVMDVPRAFDLGHDDDVELVADGPDDLDQVVQYPGAVERVDARPQRAAAEVGALGHLDESGARRLLGVERDRVFQVAAEDVNLLGHFGNLGPHLVQVRWKEMNHPLRAHRQFAQRGGSADGQRLVEIGGQFHGHSP